VHTDIPTRADREQLLSIRGAVCVSIYLPTAPEERGGRDHLETLDASDDAVTYDVVDEIAQRVLRQSSIMARPRICPSSNAIRASSTCSRE
jgi:hypothetical protein